MTIGLIHDVEAPGVPTYGVVRKKPQPRKRSTENLCPYNEGVSCKVHVCERCGFNPERKLGVK